MHDIAMATINHNWSNRPLEMTQYPHNNMHVATIPYTNYYYLIKETFTWWRILSTPSARTILHNCFDRHHAILYAQRVLVIDNFIL